MTIDTGARGLRVVSGKSTQLVDVHCGDCAACRVGRDFWCLAARDDGPVLVELTGSRDGELVSRWAAALGALGAARRDAGTSLLILADRPAESVASLIELFHPGPVVVARDAGDPEMRRRLSELSPTGRAAIVVTVSDVRAAVRAVERGGQVCGPLDGLHLPTVTELVQRDVTLVAPRSIEALAAGSTWADLAARLYAVLSAPSVDGANR